MLAALEGNPEGRADMGLEWLLVAQGAPMAEHLIEAPVDALKVSSRVLAALQKAGIASVRELARLTEAQWLGIKGIGGGGADEIRKALHKHASVDPKTLVPEGVAS